MALGLGTTKGLSFINEWNQDINRLYQREEYAARIRKETEDKTKYYAALMRKGHAGNAYDQGQLENYYKKLNNELADFAVSNPNFEHDVAGMSKFVEITDKYLNNPILERAERVKGQFESLMKAHNAGELDEEQYFEEMGRYDAYINTSPDKTAEPYVFHNWKIVDFDKLTASINETLTPDAYSENDEKTHEIIMVKKTPEKKVILAANAAYSDPKNRRAIDERFNNYITNNPSLKGSVGYRNAVEWYINVLKNNEPFERVHQTFHPKYMAELEAGIGAGSEIPYVFNNLLDPLADLLKNKKIDEKGNPIFADGTMGANDEDRAFTIFEEGKDVMTSSASGILVWNKDTDKYDKFQFNTAMDIKYINSSQIVTLGGIPYLKAGISFVVPTKDNLPVTDYGMEDKVGPWNLKADKPASGFSIEIGGDPTSGQLYKGEVLLPMIFDENRAHNWNKLYQGVSYSNKVAYATTKGMYDLAKRNENFRILTEMARSGRYPGMALYAKYKGNENEWRGTYDGAQGIWHLDTGTFEEYSDKQDAERQLLEFGDMSKTFQSIVGEEK